MYLGLDLGTSGVKALLIDDEQALVASTDAGLDVSRPHPGWSEQEPADWIAAAENAIGELHVSHPEQLGAVRGIGLSGQMHGATLLDDAGQPLRPCILWNDTRSHAQAAVLDSDPAFRRITGNIVFPGFTAPKLDWVRDQEPKIFAATKKVLLPKDYLRLWLSGDHCSDMSDAAGTAWLDTGARDWSDELLSKTLLGREHMPALAEGTAATGTLRPALAARWGMGSNVVIAGGAGDNAASAIGMGAIHDGQAFVSLGTSGVLFAATDDYRPNAESAIHTFCHALSGTWHQMGVILSATDALNWHAGLAGAEVPDLIAELGGTLKAPGPVVFLPYLAGERTPHNDAAIRGVFAGLSHATGHADLTRAVLEGVAFALADSLDALRQAGTAPQRVMAVGGGARSELWLKIIATVLDIAVDVPADGDFGAAFGAARLGLAAAESADPAELFTPPAVTRSIEPDTALAAAFGAARERFVRLYPAVREAMA